MTDTSHMELLLEQEKRLSQCLPTLFTLVLTLTLPWMCQYSLSIWRAAQVYDAQSDKHEPNSTFAIPEETEKKKPTTVDRIRHALQFVPAFTQILMAATANIDNESRWPAIAFVRKVVPFALLFCLFSFALLIWLDTIFTKSSTSIFRSMGHDDKKAKQVILNFCSVHPLSNRDRRVRYWLFIVVPSALLTYFCYATQRSWHVLALVAVAFVPFNVIILIRSATSFDRATIRTHLRCMVFVALAVATFAALVLAVLALILISAKGYKNFSFSSITDMFKDEDKCGTQDAKRSQDPDSNYDVPSVQLYAIVFQLIWGVTMLLPASLVTLLYRYEQSKAGLTTVLSEEADVALSMSKSAAEVRQSHLAEVHPFDTLGRTPILIDCNPIKVDRSKLRLTPKPLCTSAIITLIVLHIFALDSLSGFSSAVLVPFFPHDVQDVRDNLVVSPITISFVPLLAHPFILIVVIPLSTVISSLSRGESIGANFRHLWKYEEKWCVDYKQAEPPALAKAEQEKVSAADDQKLDGVEDRLVDYSQEA